ncbi:MAG: ImmA/IrrE family metallo-endopeptidase [Actinobacteria bacterium]|nr:MAG: ImmA/IrrE family metallo-endopeptidase [Actinomycetota bacterium]
MRQAVEKAKETYKRYGTTNPAILARALGICVLEEELAGRVREIYFGDSIVIRKDMTPAEKRAMLAHALGHHFMHAGNHLAMQKRVYSFGNRHEKQADVFAACFLVPEDHLEEELAKKLPVHELAECFGVTESLIRFRLIIRRNLLGQAEENAAIEESERQFKRGEVKPEEELFRLLGA